MPVLLLLFLAVPIAEIAVFIQAGDLIGLWPTLGLCVATAVIGSILIRAQGLAALMRARATADRGAIPMAEVFTGLCLFLAGALLMTPGFITDTIGFLLLIPPVRAHLGKALVSMLVRHGNLHVYTGSGGYASNGDSTVIDADFTDITDKDGSAGDGSGRKRGPGNPPDNPGERIDPPHH